MRAALYMRVSRKARAVALLSGNVPRSLTVGREPSLKRTGSDVQSVFRDLSNGASDTCDQIYAGLGHMGRGVRECFSETGLKNGAQNIVWGGLLTGFLAAGSAVYKLIGDAYISSTVENEKTSSTIKGAGLLLHIGRQLSFPVSDNYRCRF